MNKLDLTARLRYLLLLGLTLLAACAAPTTPAVPTPAAPPPATAAASGASNHSPSVLADRFQRR
jgi:hypothetical protein